MVSLLPIDKNKNNFLLVDLFCDHGRRLAILISRGYAHCPKLIFFFLFLLCVCSLDEFSVDEEGHLVPKKGLERVDIAFDKVRLELAPKKGTEPRVLLDGSIHGRAKPGRMLAIMGPSGAGKSVFLHALAGRIKYNRKLTLAGERYLNGQPVDGDSMIPSAFIEQEFNFFPHMTVRETLEFRVSLKLGSVLPKNVRDDITENLMKQLGLLASADTVVGDAKVRGISGGEKKRLSIATEMISAPPVIFLDEPTSVSTADLAVGYY